MNKKLIFYAGLLSMGMSSCGKPCPEYEIESYKSGAVARELDIPLKGHKMLHLVLLNRNDATEHAGKIAYASGKRLEVINEEGKAICYLASSNGKACDMMFYFSNNGCKGSNDGMSYELAVVELK